MKFMILPRFSIRLKKLYVFATASLRNVIHSEDAVEEIRRRTGFDVQILSGEDEARYGYYGLLQEQNTGSGLVVDVGGGSTELTAFASETGLLEVKGYSRQGFAFKDGYEPGAYKADGTLKAGAKVLYVTKNNAKTAWTSWPFTPRTTSGSSTP